MELFKCRHWQDFKQMSTLIYAYTLLSSINL